MIVTDLFYKLLAFTVLTPFFSMLSYGLLAINGNAILSDLDIAMLFAGPFGWICAFAIGDVWLAIFAFEQASLIAILAASTEGKRLSAFDSLRFAFLNAPATLRVACRLIAFSLLVVAPFVLLAASIYYATLGDYDINYYLHEQPFSFQLAMGSAIALVTILVLVLLRLYSGWFLALPLVLFDRVVPKNALRQSRQIIAGNRLRILRWLVAWFAIGFAANVFATLVIGGIGRLLIPANVGSVTILAGRVGLMLVTLTIASVIINLVGTISFALILFHAYRELNPNSKYAIDQVVFADAKNTTYLHLLTRPRLLALSLIGGLFALLIGVTALNSLQLRDRIEVMAHRGASDVAPENSISSVRYAIDAGADWVEIDVQETADGEVVVFHDSDLMKLARNKLKIWDATMEDLRRIDIGSSFDTQFAEERVPTLADVLEICRGKIGVIIELKYYGHDRHLEQRVVDIVEHCEMANDVMVMSMRPDGMKKLKAIRPLWKCGLILSVSVGDIQRIEADFLAVNAMFATRSLINRSHTAGKQVFVWTIDDAATMSRLMNRGIDGILTNSPKVAREVLKQRSKMSSSERLLTELAALLGMEHLQVQP